MTEAFPLIEAAGPPFERGVAIGRQGGDRIARSIALYDRLLDADWEDVRRIAMRYLPRLEAFDPAVVEEMRGMAAGAERTIGDIVALNARTELIHDFGGIAGPDGCTGAIALPETTANGHLLHGQNWDWFDACKDTAVVLRIEREDGLRLLIFVEAGIVARAGMNSHGIAVTGNFLACPGSPPQDAVPIPFIRRRILESPGFAVALGCVLNARRSFPANLMISDAAGEAVDLETTPQEVFWEKPGRGLLVHANHFRTAAARARVIDTGLAQAPSSIYRDSRVERRLSQSLGHITSTDLEEAFADTWGAPSAVLASPGADSQGDAEPSSTVATVIMDTTERVMRVARAPYAGRITFSEYRLDG